MVERDDSDLEILEIRNFKDTHDQLEEDCHFEYENAGDCKCIEEFRNTTRIDSLVLPSTMINQNEIYFPKNLSKDDPRIYGKWIINTHGNLKLQDHLWIQLQKLLKSKELILLGSSITAIPAFQNSFHSMIKCYTCKDLNIIKNSGLKICSIQKDLSDLKYETNGDSQNNPVIEYVISSDRKLFKREKGCKFAEVADVEPPAAKRKRMEADKCDDQDENSCQFEFGADMCKCVKEFIKKECKKDVDVVLPSTVIDKEEICFPPNINYNDPSIYGKWLIFTNGNIRLQNHLWVQLRNLIESGDLILVLSSTAKTSENRGPFQGVIMCYTSKDIKLIRRAGLGIQNILKDDTILDYKTNEASQNNLYRSNGARFISKFMITVNGKLYKRDKLCRWIQLTDAEYENYMFEENSSNSSADVSSFHQRTQSESNLLPSLETRKKRKTYSSPNAAHINNLSGLWCISCSIMDDAGSTELDRAWKEAKSLREENFFRSVTCQTKAFRCKSKEILARRAIMFEVHEHIDVKQIIKCADKIREKISYNMPMYYKIMKYKDNKPQLLLKYLYTEDGELYEYTEAKWKLLKAV